MHMSLAWTEVCTLEVQPVARYPGKNISVGPDLDAVPGSDAGCGIDLTDRCIETDNISKSEGACKETLPENIMPGLQKTEKLVAEMIESRERYRMFQDLVNPKETRCKIRITRKLDPKISFYDTSESTISEEEDEGNMPICFDWNSNGTLVCVGTGHIEHTITCSHSSSILIFSTFRGLLESTLDSGVLRGGRLRGGDDEDNNYTNDGSGKHMGQFGYITKMKIPGCVISIAFHPVDPLVFCYVSTSRDLVLCKIEYTSDDKNGCFIRTLCNSASSLSIPQVLDGANSKLDYSLPGSSSEGSSLRKGSNNTAQNSHIFTHISPTCICWSKELVADEISIITCGEEGKLLKWGRSTSSSGNYSDSNKNLVEDTLVVLAGKKLNCEKGSSAITAAISLLDCNSVGKRGYTSFVLGTEDGKCCTTNIKDTERKSTTDLVSLDIHESIIAHTGSIKTICPLLSYINEKNVRHSHKQVLASYYFTSGMGSKVFLWSSRKSEPILSLISTSITINEPKAYKKFHQTPPFCSCAVNPSEPNAVLVGGANKTLMLYDLLERNRYVGFSLLPSDTLYVFTGEKGINESEEVSLGVVRGLKFNPKTKGIFCCIIGKALYIGQVESTRFNLGLPPDTYRLGKLLIDLEKSN